ncbi:MAG: YdeI family protein [Bacteroidota bacterium]
MNPKVEFFFSKASKWQEEYKRLRTIILDCGLTEELKWGQPCYTFKNANVILIHGFKEYCAVLFPKGVLLKDQDGILIQQTENVQSARQVRFTGIKDIVNVESSLKNYIYEAIEVEKAGLKVKLKETKDYKVPDEFKAALDRDPKLKTAFEALTPGRQRAYLFHFSQPKKSETRESRIEKAIPDIFKGKGLND